jgi:hypothetical protein
MAIKLEEVKAKLEHVKDAYYRLILIVAPLNGGKTAVLRDLHQKEKFPFININLELSRRMLDLTQRQRILKISTLLEEIVNGVHSDTVLLDNLEILFDTSLKQDPLRLLQSISRNITVIASWNGMVKDGYLIYASPEHPEYKKILLKDIIVVTSDQQAISESEGES